MSEQVAPGAAYTSRMSGFPTGGTGTFRFRLIDNDGTADDPFYGPAIGGILEDPTGSGVYLFRSAAASTAAPTVAGKYSRAWDRGAGTDLWFDDDLIVTDSPTFAAPSGTAYVSAATLKETLSLGGETFEDADLAVGVEAASRAVDNYCGRFFYLTSAGVIRYFSGEDSRRLRIDDLVAASQVALDLAGGTSYATVLTAGTDYTLEPFNASELGRPYTVLESPRATGNYIWPTCYSRAIKITGQWGWPSVPGPIVEATSILAARFVKRAREAPFGIVGIGVDGGAVRISRFDSDIQLMLDPYCRRRLLV